jgi:hypothetical protein
MNLQEIASFGTGCGGLTLGATGVPTWGGSVTFTTGNVNNASLGVCVLAPLTIPIANGIDLSPLGMPGCSAYAYLPDGMSVPISWPGGYGLSVPVTIPFGVPAGTMFSVQSLWFVPAANQFGAVTSNGVRVRIG